MSEMGINKFELKICKHEKAMELDNRYWWCGECGALRDNKYDWTKPQLFWDIMKHNNVKEPSPKQEDG